MQGARDSAHTELCRHSHAKVPFQFFTASCLVLGQVLMRAFSSSSGSKVSHSVGEVGKGRSISFVSQSQMPGSALEKDQLFELYLPICYLCEGSEGCSKSFCAVIFHLPQITASQLI